MLDKIPTYILILTYADDIIILGLDSQEVKMGTKNESKTKYILISRRVDHGKHLEFENLKKYSFKILWSHNK